MTMKPTRAGIAEVCHSYLWPKKMHARVTESGGDIYIEPDTKKTGTLKAGRLDGMQIIYFAKDGIYEVSEYMAGAKENELWIYKTTRSLKIALKELLRGNNRKSKAIKIYK